MADRLRRARRLRIQGRRLVARGFTGEHRSIFQGTGIEFESVREYGWGDDIRAIDWNVTARTGRPFIKRFVESRDRAVWIAVDRSASMDFGGVVRSKADAAAELAVWIVAATEATRDKVGLLLFAEELERCLEPRRNPGWADRLVEEVVRRGDAESINSWRRPFWPNERTPGNARADLDKIAAEIPRVARPRDIVFLVSDFHSPPASRSLAVLSRRQELVCIRVTDPRELELSGEGIVTCVDRETNEVFSLDAGNDQERRCFKRIAEERQRSVTTRLRSAGAELLDLSTEDDVLSVMMKFFARRAGQR